MPYTSQGYMTAEDVAEVRRDMDLDLCACCEDQDFHGELDDPCEECSHTLSAHGL